MPTLEMMAAIPQLPHTAQRIGQVVEEVCALLFANAAQSLP